MKQRIVILTGSQLHHKYFCNELNKNFTVESIIIERKNKSFKSIFNKIKKHGALLTFLKITSKLFHRFDRFIDTNEIISSQDNTYYFNKNLSDKTFITDDINNDKTYNHLKGINPDYICSLGGGLIKEKGLSCAKKMALNFHSGISPFYNGADINFKVFESRNLNFIGGTLMEMTPRIDGGPILAHFLPSISKNDNPHSLFLKGIVGCAKVYIDFIKFHKNSPCIKILQLKPMHYYIGYDNNLSCFLIVRNSLKNNICSKFIRDEKVFDYFRGGLIMDDLFKYLNFLDNNFEG